MCGRYELVDGQRLFVRFNVARVGSPLIAENTDTRPTGLVPVVTTDHTLSLMHWGLVPPWAHDPTIGQKLINARAEGIATKPSFRAPLRTQRCLIPASAFFAWTGRPGAKTKYRIARRDGELFAFAGLYARWKGPDGHELKTCAVITTQPNAVVAPIHTRMPVILLSEEEAAWINPDMTEPEEIMRYLRPYPADLLEAIAAA